MSKQYGLIKPNSKDKIISRPSIFDESDSDEPVEKPTGIKRPLKKQDRLTQNKAVEEDPTVYQYDEIYDEMDKKRKESKLSRKDLDRKPKYINRLLVAAERRKRENERRIERQVQKERETEGDEFKDKEAFVTSSYKKKLEEMKEMEEQEKREEYLESIGDVKKQGNLDGFYRHLYEQKVNYEDKGTEDGQKKPEDEEKKPETSPKEDKSVKASSRKYRRRQDSENESENDEKEEDEVKKEHLPSNLDADSDFSIDSSDSDDEKEGEDKKLDDKDEKSEEVAKEIKTEEVTSEDQKEEEKSEDVKVEPKKEKIDIWKKRTVGDVFDAALKRYFERRAIREL